MNTPARLGEVEVAPPHSCFVDAANITLVLVIVTALAFDFTNGFHDTGNAMATLDRHRRAQAEGRGGAVGVLNLVGAFLSIAVARPYHRGHQLQPGLVARPDLVADGGEAVSHLCRPRRRHRLEPAHLAARSAVQLVARADRRPHRRGAAGLGWAGVNWTGDGTKLDGVVGKSSCRRCCRRSIALIVATAGTWLVYRVTRASCPDSASCELPLRPDRLGVAGLAGARHQRRAEDDGRHHPGADRQRRSRTSTDTIRAVGDVSAARVAIAAGTYLGGWRVIRTLGKGLVEIESPQGMAAETSSAAIILLSSHFGYALSTTHVATGSILGSGLGKPGAEVRWAVAGRMVTAWATTFPIAALMGALMWWIGRQRRRGGRRERGLPHPRRRSRPGSSAARAASTSAPTTSTTSGRRRPRSPRRPTSTLRSPMPGTTPTTTRPSTAEPSPPRPRPTEDGRREHPPAPLKGASEVLVAGLVFGAGLPFVYALALRVLTIGSTSYADPNGEIHSTPRMSSRLFAGLLIAVVVAGVIVGMMIIVATGFGKEVSLRRTSTRRSSTSRRPPFMNPLSGPVLQWIREGYPDGVPDDETAALLAVLQERIGGDRALDVLRRLHQDGLITDTAAAALLPDDAQMRRVSAKLVLGGWPLAGDEEDDDAPPKEGSALARIVSWLREGYPGGVPEHDYMPLIALLERRLTRSEVKKIAKALRRADVSPAGPPTSPPRSPSTRTPSRATTTCAGCATSSPRRAGRSSSPTPTWTERAAHDGPGCRVRTSRTRHPPVRGRVRTQQRPSGFPHGRASLALGVPAQTSMPRRRAERARCRLARSRRSRLTSIGSASRASGRSMSALSTW